MKDPLHVPGHADSRQVEIWAPFAKTVELTLGERRMPMQPDSKGYWRIQTCTNQDYGFSIDGDGPFPDPRSRWQPFGVHALSRYFDPSKFKWSDSGFNAPPLANSIIYELHVGTFTPEGTFVSIIEKLDHLIRLGVTHLELMPVNEFSGVSGWGYDGVSLFAPHHHFGTPSELQQLVDACHARGLAVLLDVVYNHLGPSGNYLPKFGPYFTERYKTPWGSAVNFDDAYSDEVRRFLCDNALMWLRDYHFDGLRLDAVHAIHDMSARSFLEQLADEVRALAQQLDRRLVLIAESDLNQPKLVQPKESGGFGIDAQWSDDFHHALHAVITGERSGYYVDFGSVADLAKALSRAYVYDGRYSTHRKRSHGRPAEGLPGQSFLAYAQTHDQVGNRAGGERLCHLVDPGAQRIAAALVLTSPFVPMLFQGEEWSASTPFQYFTSHPEPELANAVREGRRKEFAAFGWRSGEVPDPQDPQTFHRSKLNWAEVSQPFHSEVLEWYQKLVQLRRSEPDLAPTLLDKAMVQFEESRTCRWLTIKRASITILCNFSQTASNIPLPDGFGQGTVLLRSHPQIVLDSAREIGMPARSVVLIKKGS